MSGVSISTKIALAGGEFELALGEYEMRALEMGSWGWGPWGNLGNHNHRIMIGAAYARLIKGRFVVDGTDVGSPGHAEYSVQEMNAIIGMALLGGGGGKVKGRRVDLDKHNLDDFLKEHVFPLPLMKRWDIALAALGARVEGVPADA